MSERRGLRSAKDVTLHEKLGDTTRRTSQTPTKMSSLQNTPDKTESSDMDKRGSARAIRSRKSRQQEVDLTLDMENNNSLLNSSNFTDHLNTRFEDTPAHLYGLDNPDNISPVKEMESEQEIKSHQNVRTNTKNKIWHRISYAFFILMVIALIGWLLQHASLYIQPKEEDCLAQCQNGELAEEFKTLRERVMKLEHELRSEKVPSYQNVFLDDKSFKGNSKELDKLFSSRIEQALNRWDADKIGIPDFALESSGGQIHSAYHSATFSNGAPQLLVFGIPLWYEVKTPRVIIQPGNIPGDCWAFQGKEGFVVIKLSQMIKPSSFTLEHMAAALSQFGDNSIPSAPKDFSVWGWSDAHGKEKTKLGEYVYDNEGTALQTFSVQVSTTLNFRFIELRVHSNYGNPSYTCLYRFRVHGSPYKNNN